MPPKPLLLKDFLELDPFISDDSSTTVRYLLESELYSKGSRLIRSRSKGALTKISTVINNAVKNFPLSSPTRPPGFSKKLRRRFWKKEEEEEEVVCKKVTVKDIVRLNSFELYGFSNHKSSRYFPSPVVSSCSEEADTLFGGGLSPRSNIDSNVDGQLRQPEEVESQGCNSEEEKEQLSPISVMDFPYQEDEEGDDDEINEATSSCFQQNLVNIERTTHQLLQKIRRFESIAELDPVNLDQCFANVEEDEDSKSANHVASFDEDQTDDITAWDLIRRLKSVRQMGPHGSIEKLLVDYFMEGLYWSKSTPASSAEVDGLISTACDWMDGAGCLDEKEHGKDQLTVMERNGRWRSFEDGKDDVAADVEANVLRSLLHELVIDLVY